MKKKEELPKPKSKFLLVKCSKCKNEQVVFNKPATVVKCLVCDSVLVDPKGGMGEVKTKIIEALG
jgi:small subunit ribosomal protein S27e